MIHTVETAGIVDSSSAGSFCIVELSWIGADMVGLGLIFVFMDLDWGARLETIEESEFG